MSVTVEEKAELAKKLGMGIYADRLLSTVEAEQEVKQLTDLNLKVTNAREVQELIGKKLCWRGVGDEQRWALVATVWIVTLIGVCAHMVNVAVTVQQFDWQALAVFLAPGLLHVVLGLGYSQVRWMALGLWDREIPYGALLAVQEAQAKGVTSFDIAYPALVTRAAEDRERFLYRDPVIVGYYQTPRNKIESAMLRFDRANGSRRQPTYAGRMVQVFAWDAGKVYE